MGIEVTRPVLEMHVHVERRRRVEDVEPVEDEMHIPGSPPEVERLLEMKIEEVLLRKIVRVIRIDADDLRQAYRG